MNERDHHQDEDNHEVQHIIQHDLYGNDKVANIWDELDKVEDMPDGKRWADHPKHVNNIMYHFIVLKAQADIYQYKH